MGVAIKKNKEVWKPVHGWRGFYEVSNLGRVRSCARTILVFNPRKYVKYYMSFSAKMLRTGKSKNGYPKVVLTKNSKKVQKYVHALILEAFVCPRPFKNEARHLDGVRANSVLKNLSWGTCAENALDKIRHGRGGADPYKLGKLSQKQVIWIRKNFKKFSQREIGRKFNLSHSQIGACIRNESYK